MIQNKEILTTLFFAAALLLMLVVFIVSYAIMFQRRKIQFMHEKESLKAQFEHEILQTQIEVQNQTLQNVGHELHDNIGQLLMVAKLNLNIIQESWEQKKYHEFEGKFYETKNLLSEIIQDVRGLSKSLDGNFVQEFGLSDSIANEMQRLRKICKFETELVICGEKSSLGFQPEIMLFRILQEILTNCMKHAEAQKIVVKLTYHFHSFEMDVFDNGKGFNIQSVYNQSISKSGVGLRSIHKRVDMLRGNCVIESENGKGTCIKIAIPLPIQQK